MKRIVSAMAAASMLFCMTTATVSYAADVTACELKATANKEYVHPGEEVVFTVTMTPNGDINGYDVFLNIPEGLTFVRAEQDDELVKKLGWNDEFVQPPDENALSFAGVTFGAAYTAKETLTLGTVTCKAESDIASGSLSFGFTNDSDVLNLSDEEVKTTSSAATVKIPGLKHVDAEAAKCNAEGHSEYWECDCGESTCTRIYSENDITKPTTLADITIAKTEHTLAEVVDDKYKVSDATCKDPAKYYKSCTGCGEKSKDTFTYGEIDPNAHKGGEATCSAKAICEVCGKEYGEPDPNNHKNTELRNVKEATETEEGYTGDTWCKDCEKEIKKGEVIAVIPSESDSNSDSDSDSDSDSGSGSGSSSSASNSATSSDTSSTSSSPSTSSDTSKPSTPGYSEEPANSLNSGNSEQPINPSTGITMTIIPLVLAAGATVVIVKNKKR